MIELDRLAEARIRTCHLCDPAGYLPNGQPCHHNPEQAPSPERTAAKARARAAVKTARRKSTWKPAPPPDERRVQEPEPPGGTRVTGWTPEALAAEAERRLDSESRGLCPDSGYTIGECWAVDLCDCAWAPPHPCPECGTKVWDLADHGRRQHP
jgi:hypothetical protein